MSEIGIVIYKKGIEPGSLDAKWFMSPHKGGTGKATGGPGNGFAGKYQIKYFDENGEFDTELELEIIKVDKAYQLLWKKEGVLKAKGTGMELTEGLTAGWQSIT